MDPSIIYILTAVLSYTVSPFSNAATGYQTSAVSRHPSLEECRIAADELLDTYRAGEIAPGRDPDKGRITCTAVKDGKRGERTVVYTFR